MEQHKPSRLHFFNQSQSFNNNNDDNKYLVGQLNDEVLSKRMFGSFCKHLPPPTTKN